MPLRDVGEIDGQHDLGVPLQQRRGLLEIVAQLDRIVRNGVIHPAGDDLAVGGEGHAEPLLLELHDVRV
jgi:hypothetical protein